VPRIRPAGLHQHHRLGHAGVDLGMPVHLAGVRPPVPAGRISTRTETRMAVFDYLEGFYNPSLAALRPGQYT